MKPNSLIPIALPDMDEEECRAASEVIHSGWLTQGPVTKKFEDALSTYLGSRHTYCVSSCTTGLFLALKSAGIGPDDEVIVPSYSFIATANCVTHTGATPIFADIDPLTLNLDIDSVKNALSKKTKAILLVHQVGIPANIDAFQSLCRSNSLKLIEDAACAIGSEYRGKRIGSHSDWVVFSFHPRKILTTGEGGAICYNGTNENTRKFLNISRKHGMDVDDLQRHQSNQVVFESYPDVGYNFRLTDIQAAIGLVQLTKLEKMLQARRQIAQTYQEAFADLPGVTTLKEPAYGKSNFQTFLLRLQPKAKLDAPGLMTKLLEDRIATRRGVMCAHLEPCYSDTQKRVPLTESESAAKEQLVLPLYTSLKESDLQYIIERVIHHLS